MFHQKEQMDSCRLTWSFDEDLHHFVSILDEEATSYDETSMFVDEVEVRPDINYGNDICMVHSPPSNANNVSAVLVQQSPLDQVLNDSDISNEVLMDCAATNDSKDDSDIAPVEKKVDRVQLKSSSDNGTKQRKWEVWEDTRLIVAARHHGMCRWRAVAEEVGNSRNHMQVLQRWKAILGPAFSELHWSETDDLIIQSEVHKLLLWGYALTTKEWKMLASKLTLRSGPEVASRWNELQSRERRLQYAVRSIRPGQQMMLTATSDFGLQNSRRQEHIYRPIYMHSYATNAGNIQPSAYGHGQYVSAQNHHYYNSPKAASYY